MTEQATDKLESLVKQAIKESSSYQKSVNDTLGNIIESIQIINSRLTRVEDTLHKNGLR